MAIPVFSSSTTGAAPSANDGASGCPVGMPPTGGVDRLVMFLLEQNIREVLAFPFVKPE